MVWTLFDYYGEPPVGGATGNDSYGLYSHGPYRYGPYRYGLSSYDLSIYGLYKYCHYGEPVGGATGGNMTAN